MNPPTVILLRWEDFAKVAQPALASAHAAVYVNLDLRNDHPVPRGETVYLEKTWVAVSEAEFKRRALGALTHLVDELWDELVESNQQEAA